VRTVLVVAVAAGCARSPSRSTSRVTGPDPTAELRADSSRFYTLWLGGARVGTAIEREHWTTTGMTLARTEQLHFLRGDTQVDLTTAITIDASAALTAERVRWTESGTETRGAEAVRTDAGWQLSTGGTLASSAVPAELVPLLVRRDGHFTGPVFLPARGFVSGDGRIEPVAPHRLVARIALAAGPTVEATIDLDRDGAPARIVDGEGVIALRATEHQASEPFPALDLIAATALPITGARAPGPGPGRPGASSHAHDTAHIVLAGNVVVPALPGQRAQPIADGVEVELAPSATRAPAEIRALVADVRARISPSLAAGPASPREAATATAGDCTTYALAYAALATSRGIPTRVVTGLRVDSDRLIRHRWAISWTGDAWIAVDAAFDRVPAGGDLIGLSVHDADDAGLIAGEAALTQVHAAHWK
jgi:hypothetical protein